MPAPDLDKERIATGRPDGHEMTDRPDGEADEPEAQAETHGPGERTVHDRDGTRRTAEEDMLGQGTMDGHRKARHGVELFEDGRHQTSTPPPKLKKLRKNELAAKAIDRPKTIWIRRRKPPLVSPKAVSYTHLTLPTKA